MDQYILEFQKLTSFDEEDYFVTSSNHEAVEWVKNWPNAGSGIYKNICCLIGENGCGKTHLTRIWGEKSKALLLDKKYIENKLYQDDDHTSYILDDLTSYLDKEECLFHLLEDIISKQKHLLIASTTHPSKISFTLPDLGSRVRSFLSIEIRKPDEITTKHILVKYFSDRQITVKQEAVNYLVSRLKFSYKEIAKAVDKLDKESLIKQKNISIPFIKEILSL